MTQVELVVRQGVLMKEIMLIERGLDDINDLFFRPLIEGEGDKRLTRLSIRQAMSSFHLQQKPYSAGVLDCLSFDRTEIPIIEKISRLTHGMPLILTAKNIDIDAFRALARFKNVVTLQRFFRVDIFHALLDAMCERAPFRPRVCPRFQADWAVRVAFEGSHQLLQGHVRNYSSSGMLIEWRGGGKTVRKNERVRITVPVASQDDVPCVVHLDARVVWSAAGNRGAGIQFLNPFSGGSLK